MASDGNGADAADTDLRGCGRTPAHVCPRTAGRVDASPAGEPRKPPGRDAALRSSSGRGASRASAAQAGGTTRRTQRPRAALDIPGAGQMPLDRWRGATHAPAAAPNRSPDPSRWRLMPSTPRGQRTRNLIIERTAAVFDQQGFAGATLNQLVAATGLTRGAFYFHFDSKDALAEAIVQTQQDRWLPIIDELEQSEPDPLRRLIRVTYRSGALFQRDSVMRAGSRLMTERSLIGRQLWRSYPWWVSTIRGLLNEAADELADTSSIASASWPPPAAVPDGVPRGIAALAEHLVGMWTGVQQQAIAAGRNDLPERVRASG